MPTQIPLIEEIIQLKETFAKNKSITQLDIFPNFVPLPRDIIT